MDVDKMLEEESDAPTTSKKKLDKSTPAENLTVTVDKVDAKKNDKSDGEDPKPRIVLTFRSEKTGSKNSNMKIVSSEEKHEEFSPRRSNRTRGRWEWTDDNDSSISPKKDKSTSQSVSENEEASDSSHTTPKRSTRRRSKDTADNVLATAIARKEKSYNETAAPTRPSRRIKPTAKILANEELRIGLESQNNARLGVQTAKPEEGVRTRRSARPSVQESAQAEKKIIKTNKSEKVETENMAVDDTEPTEDDTTVMKLKHLCELGLKAIDSVDEDAEIDNRESEENDVEVIEDEDEEIDDDSEVISKLLEADDDSDPEASSDEDFYCSEEASQSDRPRRSRRLNSSYGHNDSDRSSPPPSDEKVPLRRSSRRRRYNEDDSIRPATCEYLPPHKTLLVMRADEVESEPEQEENSNPAAGDEGPEAACPVDKSTIVATCYCEKPSNMYAAPSELTEPVFCQAIELVDGVRVGCSHVARRSEQAAGALLRAGPRAPFMLACALHTDQLRKHMCCPACGLFCTQGIFWQCSSGHLFHVECGLPYGGGSTRPGCPHCGVRYHRWQPANRKCWKVKVDMHCTNKRIFLPDQREQCTQAYLSFSPLQSSQIEQGPLIPQDLLPSPPVDLKRLSEKPEGADYEEMLTGSPLQRLCDAIIAGETADQLISKIASCKCINESLQSAGGGTVMHVAARRGHLAALYLLQFAGAELDACDASSHTPLMVAVLALVDKKSSDKLPKEPVKEQSSEKMEIDENKESDKDKGEEIPEMENKPDKEEQDKPDMKDEDKPDTKEHKILQEDVEKDVEKNKPSDEELLKVIRYLVAAGCDVNFPGPEGMTALHMCAAHGGAAGAAAARALLAAPAVDVDPRDQGGWTPLVWAAEHRHSPLVSILLEAGADANAADNEGNAAVHWCALGGDAASLLQLIQAAPLATHATNKHTDTPLHVAARQGHYACVVILLARGARTDAVNSAGETPLSVCGEHERCRSAIALNIQMGRVFNADKRPHRLLCNDISRGRERFPVPCVNEMDDEPPPTDFTYVTSHVMPTNVHVDYSIPTLQGCSCAGGQCASSSCACCVLGVRRWYSPHGRLHPAFPYHEPPMLFECNQTCGCDLKECGNSIVSRMSSLGSLGVRASVFRCGGARGWGLRARQAVPRGAPVAIYCGELLPLADADTRPTDHYMFSLDVKTDLREQCSEKTVLCVDAARFGGAARFINHSCQPNLAPVRVFTNTRDLRLPTVALFATTDIRAGDELTFDYGDKFWSVKSKWMKCECGTPECRYPEKTKEDSDT